MVAGSAVEGTLVALVASAVADKAGIVLASRMAVVVAVRRAVAIAGLVVVGTSVLLLVEWV